MMNITAQEKAAVIILAEVINVTDCETVAFIFLIC